MGCPTNSLSLLKFLYRHWCPFLDVAAPQWNAYLPGSPQRALAIPFPIIHTRCLPGFEITKTCCQQACRGFGQSHFVLVTAQSVNLWKKTLKIRGGNCLAFFLFFLRIPKEWCSVPGIPLEHWMSLNMLPGCSCPLCVVSCYSLLSNLYSTGVPLLPHIWEFLMVLQGGQCKFWTYF